MRIIRLKGRLFMLGVAHVEGWDQRKAKPWLTRPVHILGHILREGY